MTKLLPFLALAAISCSTHERANDTPAAQVDFDMFFTGKTLILDHGHGLTSVYAHMSHIAVSEGQSVTARQVIAAVGQSGRATGPHLHWGVHLDGVGLDPALLVGDTPP